jgi:hypothetical protein
VSEPPWDGRLAGDDMPDRLLFSAWQGTDDAHPAGGGQPCYRAVFKTLRVAVQDATLEWPNQVLRFGSGNVPSGGVEMIGSISGRHPAVKILPEFAHWHQVGDEITYEPTNRIDPHFQGWERKTDELFYVECIVDTDATEPGSVLEEGRRTIASIMTMIDLTIGRRILGALLAEEAGERFDDGHFNRQVGTDVFCWEAQLDVKGLSHTQIGRWAREALNPWMERSIEDRRRFGLAARWYQSALGESASALAFAQFWIALETLLLPKGITHIREIWDLAVRATGDPSVGGQVGRLYGLRGDIVHGQVDAVTDAWLAAVRALAELALVDFLRLGTAETSDAFRRASGAM